MTPYGSDLSGRAAKQAELIKCVNPKMKHTFNTALRNGRVIVINLRDCMYVNPPTIGYV